jgi:hypothetical protein
VKPTTVGLTEFLSGDLKWEKQAMFDDGNADEEATEEA